MLTGRIDRDSDTFDDIDSPGIKKKTGNGGKAGVESRFKKVV